MKRHLKNIINRYESIFKIVNVVSNRFSNLFKNRIENRATNVGLKSGRDEILSYPKQEPARLIHLSNPPPQKIGIVVGVFHTYILISKNGKWSECKRTHPTSNPGQVISAVRWIIRVLVEPRRIGPENFTGPEERIPCAHPWQEISKVAVVPPPKILQKLW